MSSFLRGETLPLSRDNEPILIHRIFEHTIRELAKLGNEDTSSSESIHSIKITNGVSQETALIYGDCWTSFAHLNQSANRLARAILSSISNVKKVNPDGDVIVAVCLPPSDVLIITLMACWKVGAAYLPISPSFPSSRIEHILAESEPALVIANRCDVSRFHNCLVLDIETLNTIGLSMNPNNLSDEECSVPDVAEKDRIAIILYTSGSTGVPKGVRVKHSSILNRLKWQWDRFPYSDTEAVCIFKTALTFVDSVSEIWGPLLNARTVLVVAEEDAKDAERIMDLLEKYKVERLVLVPTLLQSMLLYLKPPNQVQGKRLSRLRLWVCSGETLSPSLVQQFYAYFSSNNQLLCNFYGSTEVMGDVTYYVIDNPNEIASKGKVPIGSPLHNSAVYLLDEELRPVPAGQMGEIYASGLNLASGYVKKRDAERFLDNDIIADSEHRTLYRTGDYGIIHNGIVYFEGRTDSQIKIRGHRVDISEVEAALKKMDDVTESVVLVHKAGAPDQALLAFVIPKKGINNEEVERKLSDLLPDYMIPHVIEIEEIPLLVNGKVDRQSLLKSYGSMSILQKEVLYEGIDPDLMERAKAVFATVVDVLGSGLRDHVKADSNFFYLGGNSLNSVYFVTKLQDLGYHISIRDFLSSPKLIDVIKKVKKCTQEGTIIDDSAKQEICQKFKAEMLTEAMSEEFKRIICTSFHEKSDLESYLESAVPYSDYEEMLNAMFDEILEAQLSFVVRDKTGAMVGAAVNKDAHKESHATIRPENKMNVVLEYLDYLELPVLEKNLPKEKGRILHNFMIGSINTLSIQETIELFIFVENEIMQMAKSLDFNGTFTTNTSPLTQQLAGYVNSYETLLDHQVNQYTTKDGTRPFARAPDSYRAIVCWKPL